MCRVMCTGLYLLVFMNCFSKVETLFNYLEDTELVGVLSNKQVKKYQSYRIICNNQRSKHKSLQEIFRRVDKIQMRLIVQAV